MNIQRLKENGIDYEVGLQRFSNNVQLYEKYLKKLPDNNTYAEMKAAVEKGDIQEAFSAAHKLKAFVGNLSIQQFYEEIQALTEEFRAGVNRDYTEDIARLDLEYDAILRAIREED